ncbi:hypothetical protein RM780_10095 [Streptomyces sp. DSM 44917]|uniref:Uncharacterized protein n=1 Tax=Streptomyces boetiae TaxID=3075541 RepID=A0ABU2L7X8_9ACTN|nr:hypothetical protein [Streptomyces sp. DSM 44917]MDT0307313.1 hypothetical protein [Streptomyces sp. DSM 44917]
MAFVMVPLDSAVLDVPNLERCAGDSLRALVEAGIEAVGVAVRRPEWVGPRLLKAVGLRNLRAADDHDLRECVRVLRGWREAPGSFGPPVRPRVRRPEGSGRLPRPRVVKPAAAEIGCGLCADPVKAGDLIGRMPAADWPYAAMGWLCHHCLYERRARPRRRDVLLRVFHRLFAGSAVDLNAYECRVLLPWLEEDPAFAASEPWRRDPLDATLARLATSVMEHKAETWLAAPTAATIVSVLHCTLAPAGATAAPDVELQLLDAIAQHLDEWQSNPEGVQAHQFGTGPRYRAQVLATTGRPTLLSVRGGPFDVHETPVSGSDDAQTPEDDDD